MTAPVHRRVDACAECGQPWPCETARAGREAAIPRCRHIVASSGKPCARKRDGYNDYCRTHYWMHEGES